MSKDLQQRLRDLRTANKNITPDKAWVLATRGTLLMQVKNTLPTNGKAPLKERLAAAVHYLVPQGAVRWISRPVMSALSAILVIAGGSIMSVSAAEQSMPGDLLYGLKLATEQARLALTSTKEDKLKLKTEFTGRRVQELKTVAESKDKTEKVTQVAEILKRDLNTLKEQLGDVVSEAPANKAVEAAKMVDQKSNEVISALQQAKDQLSPETKEKVTEAQSVAADTGVKALEVLVEKNQQDSGSIPAGDVAQALQDHAKIVTDATISSSSSTAPSAATSTASTTVVLIDLAATSTASTTSESLPGLVSQVKDATVQAFAIQKAKDQLEATILAASSTDAVAASSSTEQGTDAASGTQAVPKTEDRATSSTSEAEKTNKE